eukprot:s587_g18.t1
MNHEANNPLGELGSISGVLLRLDKGLVLTELGCRRPSKKALCQQSRACPAVLLRHLSPFVAKHSKELDGLTAKMETEETKAKALEEASAALNRLVDAAKAAIEKAAMEKAAAEKAAAEKAEKEAAEKAAAEAKAEAEKQAAAVAAAPTVEAPTVTEAVMAAAPEAMAPEVR